LNGYSFSDIFIDYGYGQCNAANTLKCFLIDQLKFFLLIGPSNASKHLLARSQPMSHKDRSKDSARRSVTWSKRKRVYNRGSGYLPDLPSSSLTRPPEVRRLKIARKNQPKYGLYTILRFTSRSIRRATHSNYGWIYTSYILPPRPIIALYGKRR